MAKKKHNKLILTAILGSIPLMSNEGLDELKETLTKEDRNYSKNNYNVNKSKGPKYEIIEIKGAKE